MAGPGRPKGSSGINKSAKIREYLEQNPDSTTTEVIEVLAQEGIDVSQPLVVGVRSRAFGVKKKRGEITINELENLNNNIDSVFDDREMVGQVMDQFDSWATELGGWERFTTAMKTALANETFTANPDSNTVEDEEDEEYQEEVQNAIASDSESESDESDEEYEDED